MKLVRLMGRTDWLLCSLQLAAIPLLEPSRVAQEKVGFVIRIHNEHKYSWV